MSVGILRKTHPGQVIAEYRLGYSASKIFLTWVILVLKNQLYENLRKHTFFRSENLRRVQTRMPQELLDVPDVSPTAQKMNGNRMTKNMVVQVATFWPAFGVENFEECVPVRSSDYGVTTTKHKNNPGAALRRLRFYLSGGTVG